jgi:DNA-directed RNA polymerase specialized sigma24 family protein
MSDERQASWDDALERLREWHEVGDREGVRSVFHFLESELLLMTPSVVRRTWPPDLIEDSVREFLLRLLTQRLPDGVAEARTYIQRAFRNHCIDGHRARVRRREIALDAGAREWEIPDAASPSPLDAALRAESGVRLREALGRMPKADRIALKLELASEWLDEQDVAWLAEQASSTPSEVRAAIDAANDMYALTRIFDPGEDDPDDPKARRDRMERFRRRRSRAREKLRKLLEEDGS